MSKLTKYLESRTKDFEYNVSGSAYFKFNNRLIRLSDHLPPIQEVDDLHILTSGNSNIIYVAAIHGKIYTFVRFGEIKNFIDHWIMIDNHRAIAKVETADARIVELKEKLVDMNTRMSKAVGAKPIYVGGLNKGGKVFDMSVFSVQQQNVIMNFIKQMK